MVRAEKPNSLLGAKPAVLPVPRVAMRTMNLWQPSAHSGEWRVDLSLSDAHEAYTSRNSNGLSTME